MAKEQSKLHRIGNLGVELAKQNGVAKGRKMPHNHPFDLVDNFNGTADEVKTMIVTPENGKNLKIHIADKSFRRKLDYMRKHNLKGRLILTLIDENEHPMAFYTGELKQHVRPSGLEKVK